MLFLTYLGLLHRFFALAYEVYFGRGIELTVESSQWFCEHRAMDRIDTSLIALRRILRATELFGKELAQSVGLTAPQLRVLQIVAEHGHCTATAISQQMRITQATVTSLVDKLVRQDLVVRQRSQTDRRQTDIVITEQGRRAIIEAPDPLQQKFVRKFSALADWEQAGLIAALERVASMLDAEELDAAPVLDAGEIRKPS